MADTVGIRLDVDGEKAFKASLGAVNAQIKALGAEMAAVTASFTKNAGSQEALAAKNDVLGRSLDLQRAKLELLNKQAAEQKEKLEALGAALDRASAEYGEHSGEALKAQNAYNRQAKTVGDLTAQLHRAEAEARGMSAAMEENNGQLEGGAGRAARLSELLEKFGVSAESAENGIGRLASTLAAAGVANTAKEIGRALMDCVGAFAEFDARMSAVQAVSGAGGDELAALAEKAKRVGAATAFTAAQAGQAFEYMAMAGWKTEEMLDGLDGVMQLAAASGEDLAGVSDIVTDALTAFGLAARDSQRFADVLAAASSNANASVGEMGETFRYAAPVAGALGYSVEDTALAVGLMANAGIKGASAGTALRAVLTNLAKPSKTVAAYMEKLNVSLTDSRGRLRSLSELLELLRGRFAALTEAEQAEYAAGLAGKEAMSGLLAVVNAAEEDYGKLKEAIEGSSGAAERMSKIRLDNYAGQVTLLESAVDGLKVEIGSRLAPALGRLAELGAGAFSWAADFVAENPWIVGAVTGLTAALGALSAAVAALTAAPAVLHAIQPALAALSANPIIALSAAAAGLAVALGTMALSAGDAEEEVRDLVKSIKESKKAYDGLIGSVKDESRSVSDSVRALKELLAAEDRSAARQEAAKRLVDELNGKISGLGLAYDGAAGSINMSADALERAAEALARQEENEAAARRLAELYREKQALADQLADAQERLGAALAEARWDSFGGEMNRAAASVPGLRESVESLTAALEDNGAQAAELEEAVNRYAGELAGAAAASADMSWAAEAAQERMQGLAEAYDEAYAEARESIGGQLGLFNELDGAAKQSVGELIAALESQAAYMESYAANIERAMERGVDEGLVQKLADGSEKSAQILDAIVRGSDEDIAKLNEQLAKVEEGKDDFSHTVAALETEFDRQLDLLVGDLNDAFGRMDISGDTRSVGERNIQGLIDGSNSRKRDLVNAYTAMANEIVAGMEKKLGIHSPSRVFKEEIGENIGLGVAEGVADSGDKAVKAADKMARDVYERSRTWAERQTKYQKLALQEQLEVWEAIQGQFIRESRQYAEAEGKIFDLRAQMQEEYARKAGEAVRKAAELEKQYADALERRSSEIFGSFKLFDEAAEKEEASGQELTARLGRQVERMREFYDGLRQLSARGVGDALVEELRAMGPGAVNELEALLRLSDRKLAEYAELYGAKQRLANREAAAELKNLREDTGRQIREALGGLSEACGENAAALGLSVTAGLADGLQEGWKTVRANAEEQSKKTVSALAGNASDALRAFLDGTPELGKQFSGKLAEGIRSGRSDVAAAVEDVAGAAVDAARRAFALGLPALGADVAPRMTRGRGGEERPGETLSRAASSGSGQPDWAGLGRTVYAAVRDGMAGAGVYLDCRKVGKIVSGWQSNENMAMGR